MIWNNPKIFVLKFLLIICVLVVTYTLFSNFYIISFVYRYLRHFTHKVYPSSSADEICLLKNPFITPEISDHMCISCESADQIPKIYETTFEEIHEAYVKQNSPVMVIDAMYDWKITNTYFHWENITKIYLQSQFENYIPCVLLTNLNVRRKHIQDHVDLISNGMIQSWFLHWKNCDFEAAKSIREIYEQPYFLKYHIPAAPVNWIILSSRYRVNKFRKFSVPNAKLLLLMQLKGSFQVKLTPKAACESICAALSYTLDEGEILVVNSELWSLHYSPQSKGISIAVLTENHL